MDEYGLDDLTPLSRAIRGQSETRHARQDPRAEATAPIATTSSSRASTGPVDFAVRIDVKGDSVAFDFDGTSGCVRAGVNVPFCYTNAMALHAIKSLTLPIDPQQRRLAWRRSRCSAPRRLHPQRAAAVSDRRPPCHGPLRDAAGLRRAGRGGARARCRPTPA